MRKHRISHREKQKAETYAIIFDCAKVLFEELGFEKTTFKKIAEKAGVTPGAIFKHFENKSALLAAALYSDIQAIQKEALEQIPQNESLRNQFLFVVEKFFEYYRNRPKLSNILVQHSVFIEGEWAEKFDTQTMRLVDKISLLIKDAQKQNEIIDYVDPKTLASALFSHYLFVLIVSVKQNLPSDTAIETLKSFVDLTISGASVKQ
jgi:AcrR family transcriptional regulator